MKRYSKKKRMIEYYLIMGLTCVVTLAVIITSVILSTTPPHVNAIISDPIVTSDDTSSAPAEPIHVPVPGGTSPNLDIENMKFEPFTDEELDEIGEIIAKAENEIYYVKPAGGSSDLISSDVMSSLSSPDADLSTQALAPDGISDKEPPEKRTVGFYFEDLKSGYSLSYNADEAYFTASIVKAPYCAFLYTLAEKREIDLEEKVTIEFSQVREGTGEIFKRPPADFPVSYTIEELIGLSLEHSDNTAIEFLRRKYAEKDYAGYAKALGVAGEHIKSITNGDLTASEAGLYIKAIYDYIENGEYGERLKEHMSKTRNPLIVARSPVVRKYGWTPLAMHDMAIVYNEHPYVLAICTNRDKGSQNDYKLFSDLSRKLEELHAKRYSKSDELTVK